jgi:Tol biopolymer transport system component
VDSEPDPPATQVIQPPTPFRWEDEPESGQITAEEPISDVSPPEESSAPAGFDSIPEVDPAVSETTHAQPLRFNWEEEPQPAEHGPKQKPDDTLAVQGTLFPPEPSPALPTPRSRLNEVGILDSDDVKRRTRSTRRLRLATAAIAGTVVLGLIGAYEWWRARTVPEGQLSDARRLTNDKGFATDPALAPGGEFVAFASDRGGSNLAIWLQNLDGGEPSRVTGDVAHDSEPDVHPDGKRIAFRSERDGGGIYVVSRFSSDPPKLLAKNGRRPRYSPDGKWLAYYEKNGTTAGGNGSRLFLLPAEGGTPRQLRADFSVAQLPAWMPDSKRLIFDGTSPGGVTDWWVTPIEDSPAVATGILPTIQQAFWSIAGPDSVSGNRVYFSASAGDERHAWSIGVSQATWKMDTEPLLITAGDEQYSDMRGGAGDMVVYSNERTSMDIWVAPAAGDEGRVLGEMRKISKESTYSHLPSVDAEGKRMIYLSNRSGVEDLWMTDLDGDSESPVTTDLRIAYRPVLSTDGTRLIVSTVEGKKCSVVVADIANRKEEVALEGCAGIWDWSPDRSSVIFFDPDGVGSRAAHLMQIPSGRRTEIVWHPKLSIYNVRFSPDGKWLVFTAGSTISNGKVYIAPFREKVVAPEQWIAISETDGSGPVWSPNGRLMYYRSTQDGFDCIWAQRLDASKRPSGKPFAVLHLHKPARGLFQLPDSSFILAVTADRLVLTLARHTGEIWMARLRP